MTHIDIPKDSIKQFCIQNQIKRLALFGSILRDDFRYDSDIDVIVEFVPGNRVGMLAMARIERELSQIFGGRIVDLRTPSELSRYFRDDVMRKAEVCYERELGKLLGQRVDLVEKNTLKPVIGKRILKEVITV